LGEAIRQSRAGFTIGESNLENENLELSIYDGDTVKVVLDGYLKTRFLGIDTPEKKLKLPNLPSIIELAQPAPHKLERGEVWRELNDKSWTQYLTDPFNDGFSDSVSFKNALGEGLFKYLKDKTGSGTAVNQYNNSLISRQKLLDIINMDKIESKKQGRKFSFFMRFSFEVFDGLDDYYVICIKAKRTIMTIVTIVITNCY
jgi:hypothetical protein